jgi:hypothetical protein
MTKNPLSTYLNDHLAGASAAVELLKDLIGQERRSSGDQELKQILAEVEEDRGVLLQVLEQAGGKESTVRKAAGWLAEKLGQAKLKLDDPGSGKLQEFEALEALALGIQGKVALWRALGAASPRIPALATTDYGALERRALNQFQKVDQIRLRTAAAALSS